MAMAAWHYGQERQTRYAYGPTDGTRPVRAVWATSGRPCRSACRAAASQPYGMQLRGPSRSRAGQGGMSSVRAARFHRVRHRGIGLGLDGARRRAFALAWWTCRWTPMAGTGRGRAAGVSTARCR